MILRNLGPLTLFRDIVKVYNRQNVIIFKAHREGLYERRKFKKEQNQKINCRRKCWQEVLKKVGVKFVSSGQSTLYGPVYLHN